MKKYPVSRFVSSISRIAGWLGLLIAAFLFLVAMNNFGHEAGGSLGTALGPLSNSLSFVLFLISFIIAFFSLILIMIGEALQMLVDIANNTFRSANAVAPESNEPIPSAPVELTM